MSESYFLTTLTARRAPSKNNPNKLAWVLVVPLLYQSEIFGRITVPEGFETDFASVPRIPLAYWLFGDSAHAAAVVHDYLCRVHYPACNISWRRAADVFYEAMRVTQVPRWRAWPMYMAVRLYRGGREKPLCP